MIHIHSVDIQNKKPDKKQNVKNNKRHDKKNDLKNNKKPDKKGNIKHKKNLDKKHVVYICLIVAVTIGIVATVITVTHKSKMEKAKKASATLKITTKVSSTTTTKPTTTEPTTTEAPKKKPPAAPVTKKYVRKKKRAKVSVKPTPGIRLKVPYQSQLPSYPTGCEAASATMLLRFYGYNVSLSQVVNAIPREDLYAENGKVYGPSIYKKFVGDPRQRYTDPRPGYGAFSPVVTSSINSIARSQGGSKFAKNITGCSFKTLLNYNKNGHPIIVWATYRMKIPTLVNSWYIKNADGTDRYFEYPRGTHVMVLIGHDSNRVYIADPYRSGTQSYSISTFADRWNLLGRQAIIMEDRAPEPSTTKGTTITKETTTTTKSTTKTTTDKTTTTSTTTTKTTTTTEKDTTDE